MNNETVWLPQKRIAKNYLSQNNIKDLEKATSGYFDYIEKIIKNHTTFTIAIQKHTDYRSNFLFER
jgi:hypothetical protein